MNSKAGSSFQAQRSAPSGSYHDARASSQEPWNQMQEPSGEYGMPQQQPSQPQPAQPQPAQPQPAPQQAVYNPQQQALVNQRRPVPYESLIRPQAFKRDWQEGYCHCCSPFSLCLESWCCPCIVYGRTRHRLRNDGDMRNFDCCNVSCWAFAAAICFDLSWVPVWLQRSDLRNKHDLTGNGCTDCLSACCCQVCDVAQVEKETERLERPPGASALGYQRHRTMVATRKDEEA